MTKTKDMLESRADQLIQFEDKIFIISNEVAKIKGIHQDF